MAVDIELRAEYELSMYNRDYPRLDGVREKNSAHVHTLDKMRIQFESYHDMVEDPVAYKRYKDSMYSIDRDNSARYA
ncbi:uncharacterized protein KY384_008623 [Bacidia gigantensis]|uniref:uncharacterized protein n=1 Tax=Bacidia gigantensis TaxID=2732470 RepID=UPI001D05A66C|nr:uncharacterized protein KY384_008623 [Bacidia gigantensis]KAG8527193.1 hypothetical protein KY384_008623 [Bacidia gigantensis]